MLSRRFLPLIVACLTALTVLLNGYSAPASPSSRIVVVAAENFYGNVVSQIAGDHVAVTSIISDPSVDPHEYETSARDAVAVANAQLVIENGADYDAFMEHLLAASPNPSRKVINVADLTGHKAGDNPHLWYDPAIMPKVAQTVFETLLQIDPANATSYRDWYGAFQASWPQLTQAIAQLKAQYAGTPVAATEPVFGYMAQAIGLNVITPEQFQKAIEDGNDPPASALAQMEDQLKTHQVKVLLYNTQTISPVTTRVQDLARRVGIPIVGVSETEPPDKSFQQWMLSQLSELRAALGNGS
jgi:zinc/manganese transport system substrate-binding protein